MIPHGTYAQATDSALLLEGRQPLLADRRLELVVKHDPLRPLKIAMIGQRGVPATFGGVEHHVEELGSRLAALGHEVHVYCRSNYVEARSKAYRGMILHHLPTVTSKSLDALIHSGLSTVDAAARRFDIVHYHALGPGLFAPLPRYLTHAKVVQTVHGLDGARAKWGIGARTVLSAAERLSARVPDATVVVSRDLQAHYRDAHARDAIYIPNGIDPRRSRGAREITDRFGLEAGRYVLFLGRLVPEKAPDLLLRAFRDIADPTLRLVIAGGSSFTDGYVDALNAAGADDGRVTFTGYVYGSLLDELYTNAACFVLPSLLEGLPLTLLEAAAYGTPIVASAIPPHVEVIQRSAPGHRLFEPGDALGLAKAIAAAMADVEAERQGVRSLRARVLRDYEWGASATVHERLYRDLVEQPARRRLTQVRRPPASGDRSATGGQPRSASAAPTSA